MQADGPRANLLGSLASVDDHERRRAWASNLPRLGSRVRIPSPAPVFFWSLGTLLARAAGLIGKEGRCPTTGLSSFRAASSANIASIAATISSQYSGLRHLLCV